MTELDLKILKTNINNVVRIFCVDGEVLEAKIHAISDEDEDVIYDLLSKTKESQYEKHDEQPAYLIRFKDIARVEALRTS